jgi:membrane protease YdiL (CAAX protease family)
VLVAVLVFFGTQAVAGALLYMFTSFAGWPQTRTEDWLDSSILASFLYMLIAEVSAIALVYMFAKRYAGGLKSIGLSKPKWLDPAYGFIAFPAYLLVVFAITAVASALIPGLNVDQKQQLGFGTPDGHQQLVLTFISLVILPPLAEELIFRGLLFSSLKKAVPVLWAGLITSLLFALGHLPEGSGGPFYIGAIDTFALSLVLVYLRQKTGRLWAGITLHALKNCVAFVALFILHLS